MKVGSFFGKRLSTKPLGWLGVLALAAGARAEWLQAAGETFEIRRHPEQYPQLAPEFRRAPEAFYEWRRRTGWTDYDAFFGYKSASGRRELLRMLGEKARQSEERIAVNFDMLTSEVLYTDRVYYPLTPEYRQHLFGGETPRRDRYPTFAVTWPARLRRVRARRPGREATRARACAL